MKIAAYTDEVHDDFAKACSILTDLGITHVCLRRVQSFNVLNHPQPQYISDLLRFNGLRVAMICTDVGLCSISSLPKQEQALSKAVDLAKFLEAKFIRLQAGNLGETDNRGLVKWWLGHVNSLSIKQQFVPLLETKPDSAICSAALAAAVLNQFTNWGLLYDPANLKKKATDPYRKYWTLLSNKVRAVDVCDIKDGVFVPPGEGDCRIPDTVKGFKEWLFLEPNIGMRYKSLLTRDDVFKHCYQSLLRLVGEPNGSQLKRSFQ